MIVSVPGAMVVCDVPGCGAETGDFSDFGFFADDGQAVDAWTDSEGQEVGGKHYCWKHTKHTCDVEPNDDCRKCEEES